ncbi:SH3 domain-containing protein [Reichenbachiella sp.]
MKVRQTVLTTLLVIFPLISFATDYYQAISDLNVRTRAGKDYPVDFILKKGDVVELISKEKSWYEIKYLGKTGYAYSKYLKPLENKDQVQDYSIPPSFFLLVGLIGMWLFKRWIFNVKRKRRRDYYRNVYLKSDDWQRKRYVVLKRDNWQCVYCGTRATQVHHKKYAKKNIGKEPIEWLVSVCKSCHEAQHS